MAEVEAQKRKEPEQAEKPEEVAATEEPPAKKAKKTVDPAEVQKQIEYYFSDKNLTYDAFFHQKISEDKEGWLNIDLLLSCRKIQDLGATADDIIAALKESVLETKVEEDKKFVRRLEELPKLEAKPPTAFKKPAKNVHQGGVVFQALDIPEDKHWGDVKDAIKVQLPEKAKIVFVSNIAEGKCTLLMTPFEGDQEFVEGLKASVAEKALRFEILYGDALKKALFNMPKHHVKKREHLAQERRKAAQKPILIADMKFRDVNMLRGKVKEIISTRKDGQALEAASADFALIKAVLGYHPKGAEKTKDMKGLKVDESTHAGTRCFWMVKEDETVEDISIRKCLDAIEANPPYAPVEEKKAEEPKSAEKKKAEEAPAEEPAAKKAKVEEKEEKKEEEKKEEEKKENAEAPVNTESAEKASEEKPKVDEVPVEGEKVAAA